MVEDPIQITETVTCGIFQLYFYENLFNLPTNSKIQNYKNSLNELFSLNKEDNEKKIWSNTLLTEPLTYNKRIPVSEPTKIVYLLLLTLGR